MSARYLGRVVLDELVTPPPEQVAGLLGLHNVDWQAFAGELGLAAEATPEGFVRAASEALGRDPAFAAALDAALGQGQRETLRIERLDLAEDVDLFDLPLAWLADALLAPHEGRPPAPARRVAVELVTLHAGAGSPPSGSIYDLRHFALRWLVEADAAAEADQRINVFLTQRGGEGALLSPASAGVNNDVPGIVWASRLEVVRLPVDDDAFFEANASAWWAARDVAGGAEGLRARWRESEEPERASLLRAEAFLHPCWLESPRRDVFASTAFWSE
ncbi:MAG TPA: hypothetical protein VFS43_34895 [Polyangiaceae bacterium]|nr:hypothetical protein [Polyangiaceae bacterium]